MTVEEIRYILYLVELQQEALQSYPQKIPNRSRAWNTLHKDLLWKEATVCKWLRRKFTKLLQDGRHAKPGLLGFMVQFRIRDVLDGAAALREIAEAEPLEAGPKQPKRPETDWSLWLKKPD